MLCSGAQSQLMINWISGITAFRLHEFKPDWLWNYRNHAAFQTLERGPESQKAKDAEDNGQAEIDRNFFEIGFGLQYDINESFLVSAGYLHANSGVNKNYQSDLSYSLNSNTIGIGGAWNISDTFKLQLGGYYVTYNEETYDYQESQTEIPYQNSYLKSTWALSLGVDIAIGTK